MVADFYKVSPDSWLLPWSVSLFIYGKRANGCFSLNCFHNGLILCQINPIHSLQSYARKSHCNILAPPPQMYAKYHLVIYDTEHACCMDHPIHRSRFDQPNKFQKKYKSRRSSPCNFLQSPVTSALLAPNVFFSILSSNALSSCSSVNVKDPSLTPTQNRQIILSHIAICRPSDVRKEDKNSGKQQQAFPIFNLLEISSSMQCYVSAIHRYCNSAIFSKDLLSICMLCFCSALWWQDININWAHVQYKKSSLLTSVIVPVSMPQNLLSLNHNPSEVSKTRDPHAAQQCAVKSQTHTKQAARSADTRNAYKILVGQTEARTRIKPASDMIKRQVSIWYKNTKGAKHLQLQAVAWSLHWQRSTTVVPNLMSRPKWGSREGFMENSIIMKKSKFVSRLT